MIPNALFEEHEFRIYGPEENPARSQFKSRRTWLPSPEQLPMWPIEYQHCLFSGERYYEGEVVSLRQLQKQFDARAPRVSSTRAQMTLFDVDRGEPRHGAEARVDEILEHLGLRRQYESDELPLRVVNGCVEEAIRPDHKVHFDDGELPTTVYVELTVTEDPGKVAIKRRRLQIAEARHGVKTLLLTKRDLRLLERVSIPLAGKILEQRLAAARREWRYGELAA